VHADQDVVYAYRRPMQLQRRRGNECNFCIHTILVECIFHVDCNNLCVKITGVSHVGKEASRNTDRIFSSVCQDGTFMY